MTTEAKKNGWFAPGNDEAVKKDLQKKYDSLTSILYMGLLFLISGYLLIGTVQDIGLYGVSVFGILKIIIFVILILASLLGFKSIYNDYEQFKNSVFYVKTCRIEAFRGETPGKHTFWYVTVQDGQQVTEYRCKNNPWFSDEQIAEKKEITIATLDHVEEDDEISMVYILDNVYPEYRV